MHLSKHDLFQNIGHTIRPHPTLGESVGMAAEIYEGGCAPTCRP